MNILCISYYDKFSRFFLEIKKELKKDNSNLKFKIFSINFSGYLYSFLRLTPSALISLKAWINVLWNRKKYSKIITNNHIYRDIDFHSCIEFHTKLNKNIKKRDLLLQAISYIDILHKEFAKLKPDILLVIGDSRLIIEIAKKMAIKFNAKIYFIEQGPFNTTIFDSKGVNANASIRTLEIKRNAKLTAQQKVNINNCINKPKPIKYNRSIIYRGMDLVLQRLLDTSILYPPDLKHTDTFPSLKFTKGSNNNVLIPSNNLVKTYLIILQVPMDANMVYHSPYYKNHFNMVKKIHKNLPENSNLVLREHPVYKNKYEKELYAYCKKHSLMFLTNTFLKANLNAADVVIVNNSTVGIEAIAMKKTVLVLGNSYYDNPEICIKYNKKDDLKKVLANALVYKPNHNNIYLFLNEFLFNYLIEGFIADKNLIAAKTISNKLKASLN